MSILESKGLERIMDAKLHMLDFVDRSHAALSEFADDAVLVDLVSYLKFHLVLNDAVHMV